jgi:uncharacterized protein (TIGR02246 family)
MPYRNLVSFSCMIGAGFLLCGSAHAGDDAAAICNAIDSAYVAAAATGDPVKMAAVYVPDGEFVTPFGVVAGRDALVKTYASFMKPGDKQADALTRSRLIGGVALCSGGFTFTPTSGDANKGFYTKVVGKVGDDWKIYVLTYNVAMPQ